VTAVRAIVRAAAYLPGANSSHPGRRSPDEDQFTLEATALERLVDGSPFPPGGTIRSVGAPPSVAAWAFPALLGAPVELASEPVPHVGLSGALAAGLKSSRPEIVVASAVGGSVGSGPAVDAAAGPDAAVAFLIGETPTSAAPSPPPLEHRPDAPVAAAVAWFRTLPAAGRRAWVGDWAELAGLATHPAPVGAASPPAPTPPSVSEGAYWPRPRYLEGLASRWRMFGERCGGCGATSFPTRGRCRSCGRTEPLTRVPLPRDGGVVRALTWIGAGGQPTEFDAQVAATGTYGVAFVEIAPGTFGTFQVADATRGGLELGAAVATRLRRLYYQESEWRYGRKVVPLRADGRAGTGPSGETG
jgi:uncharacterized OB-fold protein